MLSVNMLSNVYSIKVQGFLKRIIDSPKVIDYQWQVTFTGFIVHQPAQVKITYRVST